MLVPSAFSAVLLLPAVVALPTRRTNFAALPEPTRDSSLTVYVVTHQQLEVAAASARVG